MKIVLILLICWILGVLYIVDGVEGIWLLQCWLKTSFFPQIKICVTTRDLQSFCDVTEHLMQLLCSEDFSLE